MNVEFVAVFVAVAAATLAWSAAEWLRSRALWTIAAALMVIHSVAAFGVFYDWSQETALAATAAQTAAVMGSSSGGGLYVNYVFLVVWSADAAWWWINSQTYATRPRWIGAGVRGFVFFMFLNGAVIFADGWMRIIGVTAITVVLAAWCRPRRQRHLK